MDEDTRTLIRRLAMLLDCCQDDLDRKAAAEKRREAGKALRSVTAQQRAEAAREIIREADALVGGVLV